MTTAAPSTTIEELVQEVLDDTEQCDCRATACQHEPDPDGQCLANAKYRLLGTVQSLRPEGILLCEPCLRFLCEQINIDFDYLLATGHRRPATKKDSR